MTDRDVILAAMGHLQRLSQHVQLLKDTGTQKNPVIEDTFNDMVPGVVEILRFTLHYYMDNLERFDDPSGALLGKSKATELAHQILNTREG